ncbi:hypothetical protein M419DRAFT_123842 [Trichoderma reesei RUT C-30]|uniref:Uncharacterized protein n=1 Tax=Hypocrea jecorina (strain ATCC 56765 / BCRC 32924 / NRRL 11460 / Rut C-30) TaxID=1344414 RepID=A0A024S5F1_HYPJR|nr:hypothetical protein M419DRAFT_123842 [Trichoderma reesei RUT C-30]
MTMLPNMAHNDAHDTRIAEAALLYAAPPCDLGGDMRGLLMTPELPSSSVLGTSHVAP